jgi:hypothetical protein
LFVWWQILSSSDPLKKLLSECSTALSFPRESIMIDTDPFDGCVSYLPGLRFSVEVCRSQLMSLSNTDRGR